MSSGKAADEKCSGEKKIEREKRRLLLPLFEGLKYGR